MRPSNATPNAKTTSIARSTGPRRGTDQRFRWSVWVWSPPPESNRRPHPYHSCGPAPIEAWTQVNVTRVTVSDRQAPPEPALYGTQMAHRPAPEPWSHGRGSSPPTVTQSRTLFVSCRGGGSDTTRTSAGRSRRHWSFARNCSAQTWPPSARDAPDLAGCRPLVVLFQADNSSASRRRAMRVNLRSSCPLFDCG
jgi:hypothetical protein